MRRFILILLAIFAIAAAVSAAQINVTVTSSDKWLTADNKDEATITITVIDTAGEHAGEPFEGANVTLSVDSPWQLKETALVTDKKGVASTILLPTKVSGTANITVKVGALKLTELFGWVNYEDTQVYSQICDHTTPWSISTIYKGQASVRTVTRISVLVKDVYGNPVDNRGEVVETVRFDGSGKGLSGFSSGSGFVKSLTVPVNESGYADALYLVDPLGVNYINIIPPSPIRSKLISIEGVSTGIPATVTCSVSPDGTPYPYTPVKTGQFTIAFTFLDQFGYPTSNQPVNITTSIAKESMSLTTNKNGMVVITYGPKDLAGVYTITARAAGNLSVFASPQVEFVSGEAVDALLTASPQTMASRDVKNDIASTLVVRVMDQKGNPVSGELVNFRFKSFSLDKKLNQTQQPVLENGVDSTSWVGVNIPSLSDDNGEAVATFRPGAFTSDARVPDYNVSATATAVVEAQWSTVTRQMTLKYLNYPYLTIESEVNPTTIKVNETVDLTIRVKGDGWALQPKPIDVLLVTDRSGSMVTDYPDRMVSVMGAAKAFASQFDYSRDRLGLVSFAQSGKAKASDYEDCGKDGDSGDDKSYASANYPSNGITYLDNATLDLSLSPSQSAVNTAISGLVPSGYTSMRYALKLAIDEMKAKGNANSVRALVVLSDGDYNWYGDPLARGSAGSNNPSDYDDLDAKHMKFAGIANNTQQKMDEYAKANKVRIFSIGYAQGISAGGKETLRLLAVNTGGKYYYAPTAKDLAAVYTDIAGSLRDEAGVNTTMNLSFQNIGLGNITVPGDQVYNYRRVPGRSTLVSTWNLSTNPFPGYPKEYDSTTQWNTDRTINFNIGTIRLNQTWEGTVTLQVLRDGNIRVFDPGSKLTTENSPAPLKVPDLYITALPNTSEVSYASAHLDIRNLIRTNDERSSADLKWDLVYDGSSPISEEIMIAPNGTEDWVRLPVKHVPSGTTSDTTSIPLTSYQPGQYVIRVDVDAADANSDSAQLYFTISDVARRPQIKIGG